MVTLFPAGVTRFIKSTAVAILASSASKSTTAAGVSTSSSVAPMTAGAQSDAMKLLVDMVSNGSIVVQVQDLHENERTIGLPLVTLLFFAATCPIGIILAAIEEGDRLASK